jgi:hypothetical protein
MARFDQGFKMDSGVLFDSADPPASSHPKPMNQNLISATMTDAQRDAILADLEAARLKAAPYSVPLTPDDRHNLAKIRAADLVVRQA